MKGDWKTRLGFWLEYKLERSFLRPVIMKKDGVFDVNRMNGHIVRRDW